MPDVSRGERGREPVCAGLAAVGAVSPDRPLCSRAGRGHLIVEPACWQEALPRPAGSQHDNETVSMEMSL